MRLRSAILLLALAGGGCGLDSPPPEPVSLQSWQQSLEDYVWNQANGDPNVLRDLSWDDVHHGFAMFNDPLPDRSTDAIGLLVAHREIQGEPGYIFLFALVRSRVPIEMRAVVLGVKEGRFRWYVGANYAMALERYRAFRAGWDFPAGTDTFDVRFDGDQIGITNQQSGARWDVALTAPSQRTEVEP